MRKIFSSLAVLCLLGLVQPQQQAFVEESLDDQPQDYIEMDLIVESLQEEEEPEVESFGEDTQPLMLYDLSKSFLKGYARMPGQSLNTFGPMKKKLYLYFRLGTDVKGNPLETTRCQIETGYDQSIWFRDGSKKCESCTGFPDMKGYEPEKSSTKRRRNQTKFSIGDNAYFGAHFSDKLAFATNVNLKVPEFHFFLAERRAKLQSIQFKAGCIIGLGQKHRAHDDHLFTSQLKAAGVIKKNLYSMSYAPTNNYVSRIFFGGINTKYLGQYGYSLHYHPVLPIQTAWTVKMDQYGLAGPKAKKDSGDNLYMNFLQIDSQIDGFHVRSDSRRFFEYYLKAATGIEWDLMTPDNWKSCSDSEWSRFPDIYFQIGGRPYWISRDLVFTRKKGFCKLNMYTSDYNKWVAGMAWIQQFYTVFDKEQDRIGFYPAKLAPNYAQSTYH